MNNCTCDNKNRKECANCVAPSNMIKEETAAVLADLERLEPTRRDRVGDSRELALADLGAQAVLHCTPWEVGHVLRPEQIAELRLTARKLQRQLRDEMGLPDRELDLSPYVSPYGVCQALYDKLTEP